MHGPINLASLSPIEKIQLTSFSEAKASEDLLKSLTEDNLLMNMTIGTLEKLMPSFQKDTYDTPSRQIKSLNDSIVSHFESFEKYAKEKVRNEFDSRRFYTLKKMITKGRATLSNYVKSMQDAISVGGKLYKTHLSLKKFTIDIEKKYEEYKDQLEILSYFIVPLINSLSHHENHVISLLEKIQSLSYDRESLIGRVGEHRSHTVPKLDILLNTLRDAQNALKADDPDDIKTTKAQSYVFSGFIAIFENLQKGWNSHLDSLKNLYTYIFKFL